MKVTGPGGLAFPDGSAQLTASAYQAWAATLANATTVTETVIAQFSLAANALAAGNRLKLEFNGQVSSTATVIYRIRVGTSGLITDALAIQFATTAAGVTNAHTLVDAFLQVLTVGSSGTLTAGGMALLASGLVGPVTGAFAAATVNTTVAQKVSLTAQLSAATNTLTARGAALSKVI